MSTSYIATSAETRKQYRLFIDMGLSPELSSVLTKSEQGNSIIRERERYRVSGPSFAKYVRPSSWHTVLTLEREGETRLPYDDVGFSEGIAEYRKDIERRIARMQELRSIRLNLTQQPTVYVRRSRRIRAAQQQARRIEEYRRVEMLKRTVVAFSRPTFERIFGSAA